MNVCVKCRVEMRVRKNGFFVEEMAEGDRPYKLWFADLWFCPSCGIEVVAGFAKEPYREHFHSDYAEKRLGAKLQYWPRLELVPQRPDPVLVFEDDGGLAA